LAPLLTFWIRNPEFRKEGNREGLIPLGLGGISPRKGFFPDLIRREAFLEGKKGLEGKFPKKRAFWGREKGLPPLSGSLPSEVVGISAFKRPWGTYYWNPVNRNFLIGVTRNRKFYRPKKGGFGWENLPFGNWPKGWVPLSKEGSHKGRQVVVTKGRWFGELEGHGWNLAKSPEGIYLVLTIRSPEKKKGAIRLARGCLLRERFGSRKIWLGLLSQGLGKPRKALLGADFTRDLAFWNFWGEIPREKFPTGRFFVWASVLPTKFVSPKGGDLQTGRRV